MTDKYDDFENKLFGWISRHKLGILTVMFPIILWLIMSISMVSLWGTAGAANIEYQMNQSYHGIPINTTLSVVTKESYDTMENIIIPITIYMINTLGALMFIMVAMYCSVITYLAFKNMSRKKKNV